jgi:hypothetical protein
VIGASGASCARRTGVIQYPQYDQGWQRIARCHHSIARCGRPENLRITGVSGVGKSLLLQSYRDAHPPIHHKEYTEVPVVYAEVPAMPSSKQLAINLLEGLGCSDVSGTANVLWDRFIRLARTCGVQLVIMDEIQHFVDRGKVSTYSAAADLLKQRLSQLNVPVIMAGAPRSKLLFEANNQLRGRFKASIALYPFRIDTMDEHRCFRTVIATVAQDFDQASLRFLIGDSMAERIFYATDGIFRNLTDLVDGIRLVHPKDSQCQLDHVSQAFKEVIFFSADPGSNPFHPNFEMRRLTGPGEPYMPSPMDGDNHAVY